MKIAEKGPLLITEQDIIGIFQNNYSVAVEIVEESFRKRVSGDVMNPTKISQIFNEETQDRINCMPATLISDGLCGVKWVSVFPENPLRGMRNVTGMILLSETTHGTTVAIMDGTYVTGLRTAAVGATAVKYLSKQDAKSIGFIGAGNEARRHMDMIKCVRPDIDVCYVSSRREETVNSFILEESAKHPDVKFVCCGNDYQRAVENADIIVTATSTQADLLKADWVREGATYIHVGGWEDEYAVAQKSAKIICDEWECIKHRTQTISRMYKEGLLRDEDIYSDLGDIVCGVKPGRETPEEFIYFCSVGLAYIDIMFAKYVYDICSEKSLGVNFSFGK